MRHFPCTLTSRRLPRITRHFCLAPFGRTRCTLTSRRLPCTLTSLVPELTITNRASRQLQTPGRSQINPTGSRREFSVHKVASGLKPHRQPTGVQRTRSLPGDNSCCPKGTIIGINPLAK
ncbi:hypothetical protein DPMN_189304 [Dreissena polymorpha]|uniref:Uncharacterized protein n=1 Tax=Dreissena polymorpha TaxID=45954 RepID=A0A9D4DVB1_DREPO|nr:hypothetical protein DPMN_189304 [Dreissena polymorpha]